MIKPAILTTLAISAVGGVATGTYFLLPENKPQPLTSAKKAPSNMQELVNENGWHPLDVSQTTNDKAWGALIEKYHSSDLGSERKINTDKITGALPTNKDANIKALKGECDALLKKTEDFEKDKDIFKDWCTQETTLIDFATVNGG